MPDFSYQALLAGMPEQQVPRSLWEGISQAPVPNGDPSLLAMMLAKQRQQQDPRVMLREINPGTTWGGRDKNAIQPNDVMQSHFTQLPPENI